MRKRRPVPWALKGVRAALRRLNTYLNERYETNKPSVAAEAHMPDVEAMKAALGQLDLVDKQARAYFEKHLPRLARTLSLVPEPGETGAILELGCYMQLTPFLNRVRGYPRVRGANFGKAGKTEPAIARVNGQRFEVELDLFDAERDRFPYEDGSFDVVLACELIEHLVRDPMHLLTECRRVLATGGRLLLTTPNIASLTGVARVLHGYDNPQVYSKYSIPSPFNANDIPHVREYTAFELRDLVEDAGFEIETLITEPIAEFAMNLRMWDFLEEHGYNTSMRGEQIYCVAVKAEGRAINRYPKFLYA